MTDKTEMSTKYDPQEVEQGRYETWLSQDVFKPSENPDAKPYSIVIPPPNVTGKLHLGHAWDTTLQDMLIRRKRMEGFDTLWLPGMDHAGIATQAKVEAKLAEQDVSRYDLGREKFIDTVWEWKDEYANIIHEQWKKMGLSLDYSRERFTLDDGLSEAVRKVFVDLYNKKLIYRGEYIINWDPKAQTALSDIEVIHKDDQGAFYHVRYPLADGSGDIEIATTRPETMLGDTAIAVHPDDERYKDLVGKMAILPLVNKEIPIIADYYVDREFGTGAVKITPAHDPNDFEVGNRHNLARINVMNPDATMSDLAGKYVGMDRFVARKAIVADLEKEGYLLKVEPMVHSVGHSERTDVVVEPRLSTQWFVKMKPLAEQAIKNQQGDDKVNFTPQRFENTFVQWMENIHDWVISRQLWWGHRIPAWYNKTSGEMYVGMEAPKDIQNWKQDDDVLDTWFSSALWPFSTMGWPDTSNPDYKRYFPNNTLVTGYDIIPFWVSRMIFQSLEFTGKRPFEHALIHGLIRDEQGRKMSKSLGNGIDPMEVIDKYGADALRWFLSTGSTPGQDMRFSYEKMDASWNFINKIWNASRFVIQNLGDMPAVTGNFQKANLDLSDRFILSRMNTTIKEVNRLFESFEFGEAGRMLYNFVWNDFCDWYIEMSKETLYSEDNTNQQQKREVLCYVLDQTLRLLHPIMPFVTEKIWLTMPHDGDTLVTAKYPQWRDDLADQDAEKQMDALIDVIRSVRNIRAEVNAPLSKPVDIIINITDDSLLKIYNDNQVYIDRFCHPKSLSIGKDLTAPKLAKTAILTGSEVYIPLAELIDVDAEIKRLNDDVVQMDKEVNRLDKKLNNQGFIAKAPTEVIDGEKAKRVDYLAKKDALIARIADLSGK